MKRGDTGIASSSCSSHNLDRNFFQCLPKQSFLQTIQNIQIYIFKNKSYHYNNCIFVISIPKLREVSERYKGFGQGRVDWGENIKSEDVEMVNNYLLHLWVETRSFLCFAKQKICQCVGLTFSCFSHELFVYEKEAHFY